MAPTFSLSLPQAKSTKKKKNYQSSFTERGLREADDCGFARGSAADCVGGGGERRPQHHGGQGFRHRGCCLGAALGLQTLLDEGLDVGGHLPQHRETSLQPDRRRKQSIFRMTFPDAIVNDFNKQTGFLIHPLTVWNSGQWLT